MAHNAGDAAKAYRLRKKRDSLGPVDRLWLAEYEEKQEQERERKAAAAKDIGASRARRRIKLDVDEESEAAGTGTAATAAAAAALTAKEEGRRLDALTINAVDALKEACAVYRDICISLRERTEVLEATHVAMLESVGDHYAARSEAEIALMHEQQQPQGDQAKDLLLMMIAKKLGIPMQLAAGGKPPSRPPRGTNGAPSSS